MTWHPGHSEETATRFDVTFIPEGSGTLLTLVHSGWEALGEDGQARRDGYDGGWNGVLKRFEEAVG